jgi:hypothetical protein
MASVSGSGGQRRGEVDLVFRGRVLTDDGIVLRRVAVSQGRIVTVESVSD